MAERAGSQFLPLPQTPRPCYLGTAMNVMQREHWTGEPAFLGNAWSMKKRKHVATCALFSHQFGLELRLKIGELLRTQVCRSSGHVDS